MIWVILVLYIGIIIRSVLELINVIMLRRILYQKERGQIRLNYTALYTR